MIDCKRLAELQTDIGQTDLNEIITLFLQETEQGIGQLHSVSDPASLIRQLHVLKGCAMNLGFDGFANLCAYAENNAASGSAVLALHQLRQCYLESREALMAWRDANAA